MPRNHHVWPRCKLVLALLLATFTDASSGTKRILLLRVTFSDATEEPVSHSHAQSMADSEIEPFYREMSYGSEDMEITVTPFAYALENSQAYYTDRYGQILSDGKAAAAAAYDLSTFTDFGVVFPMLPVPWAGKGAAGSFWINGGQNFNFRILAHEVGHTYKLFHANYWQSQNESPIGPGTSIEYGDPFDIMGSGYTTSAHFNPRSKHQLGWLGDDNLLEIRQSGTYRLYCFDNPTADPQTTLAIKIPRSGGRNYWLGLRGQFLNHPGVTRGIHLTWDYVYGAHSNLIGLGPPGSSTLKAALEENGTFIDDEGGIQATLGQIQGSGTNAYVDVSVSLTLNDRPLELWGLNAYGQNNSPGSSETIIDIAHSHQQSLALRSDGTVVQWGQLYQGIAPPPNLNDVVRIASSKYACLALRADGRVEHWGHSSGSSIENASNIIEIAAGDLHCLALHSNGTVSAHGSNEYGQCNVPAGLSSVIAVSAGGNHSLALREDGTVVAWGYNIWGQGSVPVGTSDVVAIDCLSNGNVALTSEGEVLQWGRIPQGVPPTTIPRPTSLGKVRRISAGNYWVLVELEAGGFTAWGENIYGQCNLPPVGSTGIRAFNAGGYNGAFISGRGDQDEFHVWRTRHRISVNAPLDSDQDRDGRSLLEEYALDLDPNAAEFSPPIMTAGIDGGTPFLSYRLSARAIEVLVQPEVSTDLIHWEPANPVLTGAQEGFLHFRYESLTNSEILFGRLVLSPSS